MRCPVLSTGGASVSVATVPGLDPRRACATRHSNRRVAHALPGEWHTQHDPRCPFSPEAPGALPRLTHLDQHDAVPRDSGSEPLGLLAQVALPPEIAHGLRAV